MGYLKTLLAITVIIDHSPYGKAFVGGQFAVQLFYIISGFLIAHVLRTNPAYKNPFKFYLNRSLRIYPIYFAVSIATIIYIYAVDRSIFLFYFEIPAAAKLLLAVSNLTIFGQDWVMFSGIREGDLVFLVDFRKSIPQLWSGLLIPQAWTLGVELTFYAIAPFILRNTRLTILLLLLSCSIRLLAACRT